MPASCGLPHHASIATFGCHDACSVCCGVATLSQDQLAACAAIARAGNFTRAAAALHLSQPALSRRIAGLEEQLEAVVLVRGRAGVSLTEAGRKLFAFVEAQH